MIKISKRLQAICDMVEAGSRICDLGCDHAFVDIRLLQEGKISSALAMDVGEGPLSRARNNLELTELSDRVELRKSDGLTAFHAGEADTLVCTGMGGILMRSILDTEPEKAASFHQMILSPHTEIALVREWLRQNLFAIEREHFLEEEGKYYTIIRAVRKEKEDGDNKTGPAWDILIRKLRGLNDSELSSLMIERVQMERILQDSKFRQLVEDTYGPCILMEYIEGSGSESAELFQHFLTANLREKLGIVRNLSLVENSDNAAERLREISGEIGILQALLASRAIWAGRAAS